MRIPNAVHLARTWRIREIVPDFTLEDVWGLPVYGGAEAFQRLLDQMVSGDPTDAKSLPTRVLWRVRDLLGSWFDLGRITVPADRGGNVVGALPIPGTHEMSLSGRLPDELRDTATDLYFTSLPFVPLFRTDVEFAAEISNQTVHGVLHLAWVDHGEGCFQGQMAVYVKPRGRLGQAYMAFIKPFRYVIVYPALMRHIEREWQARTPS